MSIFRLKLAKNVIKLVSFIIIFELLTFSAPTLAAKEGMVYSATCNESMDTCSDMTVEDSPYLENTVKKEFIKPILPQKKAVKIDLQQNKLIKNKNTYKVAMTAYNSEPGQTDDSPCITANGFNVCAHGIEDTVAANFLPMGTKVKIPDHFGDRVFIVRDRMNVRYQNRIDVWMLKRTDALKFGVKVARFEVVD